MTRTAYSYLRMSTETQLKGDSLRRQLEASQAYAEKHDLRLARTLQDIGVSAFRGKNSKEGALANFLNAINEGHIEQGSVLIVESLDRLSRDQVLDAFNLFLSILRAGITVVTLTDNQTYTKESVNENMGQLFTSLGIMFRANEESAIKSQRLKASWSNKRENIQTQKYTSVSPAWVQLNRQTQQFQLIPDAADAVKHIFDSCIDHGKGAYAITQEMNDPSTGYPPIARSGKWSKSYIMKILHNPAVHGQFQPHKYVDGKKEPEGNLIPDYFPAVISQDRFDLAQKRLSDRQNGGHGGGRKGATFNNIFTKIAKCGSCGANMTFRDRGKPPKGGRYLRCYNAESNHKCKCPAWNYDDFEQAFLHFIREIDLAEIFNRESDDTREKKCREDRATLQKQIDDKREKYDTLESRLAEHLPESVVPGIIDRMEKINADIAFCQNREEELRQEIVELESRDAEESRREMVQAFKEMNRSLDDEARRNLRLKANHYITQIVESITIQNYDTVNPWEVEDSLPPQLLEVLSEQGFETQDQLESLLGSDYGQRLVKESLRSFIVEFKTGTSRFVQPFADISFKPTSARWAAFRKNANKRRREQERNDKSKLNMSERRN